MCHLWHSCPSFDEVSPHIVSRFKKHVKWDGNWTSNGVPSWVWNATVKKPGNEAGFEPLSWVRLTPQCNLPDSMPGFIKILLYLEANANYLLKLDTAWWPTSGKAVKGSLDVGNMQLQSVVQVLVEQESDGDEVPPAKAATVQKAFDRVNHLEWQSTFFQISPDSNFVNLTIFEDKFNCLAIKSAILYKMELTWETVLNEQCIKASSASGCQGNGISPVAARKQECQLGSCSGKTAGDIFWQCFYELEDDSAALGGHCLGTETTKYVDCTPGKRVTGAAPCEMTSKEDGTGLLDEACKKMGLAVGCLA